MKRRIEVSEIGQEGGQMRYRVKIAGPNKRTFEVRTPTTTLIARASRKQEIKSLFAHGWLPQDGSVNVIGDSDW